MRQYKIWAFMAVMVFGMLGATSVQAAPSVPTASSSVSAVPAVIKVGVLAAISGDLESLGAGITDGIKAAALEINASTDFAFDIELLIEDSQVSPTVAVAAYEVLKAQGVQLIIGATGSAASLAVAEKTATDQIVQISYSSTASALTNATYDYFYRTVPSDLFQAEALKAVLANYNFGKVVIVHRGDAWGSGLASGLTGLIGASAVVDTIEYPDATKDFSSVVTSVKAATDAEAIVMISFTEDGRALVTELRESGVNLPLVGTDGTGDESIIDAAKAPNSAVDFERNVGTKPHAFVAGQANFDAYADALTACKTATLCSDDDSSRIYGDNGYDAVWIGALAVKAADSYVGSDINAVMAATGAGYTGATGNKAFSSFGDPTQAAYDIWQFQDGGIVTIGTWDPAAGVVLNSDAKDVAWPGRPASAPGFEAGYLFLAFLAVGTVVAIRKRK